jgi:anthranilate 3-monooxygenase (FAD)/4-hydroxyphenylacetate 3-monooxygenase
MGIRTGAQYIQGLKESPREVWIQGEKVSDVTTHRAFARPLGHTAALFDLQHDARHQDTLTWVTPGGERVSAAYMPCRNSDDLSKRAAAYRITAERTLGMMGRSPDFVGSFIFGFAESTDLLASLDRSFSDNLVRYRDWVRDNDIFLTHAIITPQNDRAKTSAQQAGRSSHLRIVRETDAGLVVRGARMLATMGPLADEVLIYNMGGQKKEDNDYVFICAVPVGLPGLKQVCREPYDNGTISMADHPIAANFEDSDTLVIFDDVLVPWERVFACNDVDVINRFNENNSGRNHSSHQAAVRGLVKLQYVVGLLMKVAKSCGAASFLHVQQLIGECIHYIELMKSCLARTLVEAEKLPNGTVKPGMPALMAGRMLTSRYYARVVEILQIVGAGGMQMMPSMEDLSSPIGAELEPYYVGAEVDAKERVNLYKMAWDICGDAFGSRQVQYERYHLGDPVRNMAGMYLNYDKSVCEGLVEYAQRLTRPQLGQG